jgi:predicted nuclease of predicted toxin-antitoxin system
MKFLADAGVSQRVVHWLKQDGHDAWHVRDEGLQRLPDEQIFQKAAMEVRIILTFDLDFGEILALSAGQMVSVILFRLNNTATPFVIQRLHAVLMDVREALIAGAIVVVEDARHRIRRLPINDQ